MERAQMLRLAVMDILDRRIIAERDDLDPLQPHDPVRLGPASVIADAHADHRVHEAPNPETLVADVEIALFEMLKRRLRQVLGMPRQVDLAIAPDGSSCRI